VGIVLLSTYIFTTAVSIITTLCDSHLMHVPRWNGSLKSIIVFVRHPCLRTPTQLTPWSHSHIQPCERISASFTTSDRALDANFGH